MPTAPRRLRSGDARRSPTTSRAEDRQRIASLFTLFIIAIFFWVAFYQNGSSLTLFAERSTAPYSLAIPLPSFVVSFLGLRSSVVSFPLKPETYQFFNPFFILVLTPLLVMTFSRMREKGMEPSSASKIFTGMAVMGLSVLIMVFAARAGGDRDENLMSPLWLISSYFAVTVSEILVSPMGLSFVSKVAPQRMRGLMMGCWFGSTAIGSYGSGLLGEILRPVQSPQFLPAHRRDALLLRLAGAAVPEAAQPVLAVIATNRKRRHRGTSGQLALMYHRGLLNPRRRRTSSPESPPSAR